MKFQRGGAGATVKPLCIRTFAEELQTRMNVKVFEEDNGMGRKVKKNFQRDINFYTLLFAALSHGLSEKMPRLCPILGKHVFHA